MQNYHIRTLKIAFFMSKLVGWITETPKITQHVAESVSQSLHSVEAWHYREEEEEVESEVLVW